MRQDQDRGVPDQLIRRNPDPGVHTAVGPLLGVPEVPVGEQSAYRCPVLSAQLRQLLLHSDRHRLEPPDLLVRLARFPLTGPRIHPWNAVASWLGLWW